MIVTGVQFNIAWEDRAENIRRVRGLLKGRDVVPGGLLVLPEMFSTGFSMNVEVVREPVPSSVEAELRCLASEFKVAVLGGVVSSGPGGLPRNEAVAFSPQGGLLTRYAKQQPFSPAGEAKLFEAGDRSQVFDWAGLRIAPFVCYDLRFPELFREAVDLGAELLVVIANWPSRRASHWVALLRARAIENQAYMLGVNRCGSDPQFTYPGRSLLVDPQGEIVADAGEGESLVQGEVDLSVVRTWREQFPALRDRGCKRAGFAR